MEQFEIFKSEGGYRVAGSVYAGGPVMDCSPWFSAREEAEKAAERMEKKHKAEMAEFMERFGLADADLQKMEDE